MNAFSPVNIPTSGPEKTRNRYFYIGYYLDTFSYRIKDGILIGLPLVVAFFSLKLSGIIVLVEIFSYFIGVFIVEFDTWWNHRQLKLPEESPQGPKTEMEIILNRLHYFCNKYDTSLSTIFCLLNGDEIFIKDNLDWIEIVSLLNQLSICVGTRFIENESKGNEEL